MVCVIPEIVRNLNKGGSTLSHMTSQLPVEDPSEALAFESLRSLIFSEGSVQDAEKKSARKGEAHVGHDTAPAGKLSREIALHPSALNDDGLRLQETEPRLFHHPVQVVDQFLQVARPMNEHDPCYLYVSRSSRRGGRSLSALILAPAPVSRRS